MNDLIYKGNEPYIFISYSHKDKDVVYPIIKALADKGFRVWFDTGIEAGTEWPEYLAERIDKCHCFIAFISEKALNSHNCRREIHFAIELQKHFLSVYLEDVELTLGMKMQLNALQSMFYYKSPSFDSFINNLSEAKLLQSTFSGKAPESSAPSSADLDEWYDTACNYYNGIGTEQDYEKAFYWLKKAAEQGLAKAQNYLGVCYECGRGTDKDFSKALYWYQKAAEQGDSTAQWNLGIYYEQGTGSEQDYSKALYRYQKAAEQGDSTAQYILGLCYYYGKGTVQDYSKAFYWYQKSAEQGDSDAQIHLGNCYEKGIGTVQDYSKAFFWYQKADDQGNFLARPGLARCKRHL